MCVANKNMLEDRPWRSRTLILIECSMDEASIGPQKGALSLWMKGIVCHSRYPVQIAGTIAMQEASTGVDSHSLIGFEVPMRRGQRMIGHCRGPAQTSQCKETKRRNSYLDIVTLPGTLPAGRSGSDAYGQTPYSVLYGKANSACRVVAIKHSR